MPWLWSLRKLNLWLSFMIVKNSVLNMKKVNLTGIAKECSKLQGNCPSRLVLRGYCVMGYTLCDWFT